MRFFGVYWRVLGLLGRDRRVAVALVGANLLVAALQFLDPLLFGRVIGLLGRSGGMAPDALWASAAILLGVWVATGIGGIGANVAVVLTSERMAHRNRLRAMQRFYEHVLHMPLAFHGDTHSGRLMKLMSGGTEAMFGLWLTFFREQIAAVLTVAVVLPAAVWMNWRLAIVLIALVAVFVAWTSFVVRRTQAGQRRVEHHNSALAGAAQDALANVMVVQSFTRQDAEIGRFEEVARQVLAHQFPVLNWWTAVNVLIRAASTVAVITIVVCGTLLHVRGQAGVAEIVAFMGFATLLIGRLESVVHFVARMFMAAPQMEDFLAVLDTRSDVTERPAAQVLTALGEVEFANVGFGYPGGPPVVAELDFAVRPGMAVALVGQTGAGKSTAMALLQRLWDPATGAIRIDGHDVRDVTLESLRRSIGVVFQEALLFNRSIRENLLIGRPEATQAEIEQACRMADAHEFIARQPHGYDTLVGERGATLSGGQKQRLAIARALLKDPPILILDEATSALDTATEARVAAALKVLMTGRTTFIIAHRLSTVRDADMILVFDQGRIVERGDFQTLIGAGGRFAELVRTQLAPLPARVPAA